MDHLFIDISLPHRSVFRVFGNDGFRREIEHHISRDDLNEYITSELDMEANISDEHIHERKRKEGYTRENAEYNIQKEYTMSHICKAVLRKDYVVSAFSRNSICMIIGEFYKNEDDIIMETTIGFLLAKPISDIYTNGIYIDIFCAKQYGKVLMDYLISYAIKNRYSFIELNSLIHVLSYYNDMFQFEHRKSCDGIPEIHIPKEVKDGLKRISKDSDAMYQIIQNPDILHSSHFFPEASILNRYLLDLKIKGYMADSGDLCRRTYDINKLIEYGCFENGFKMRKCLPPSRGGTRKRRNQRTKRTRKNT